VVFPLAPTSDVWVDTDIRAGENWLDRLHEEMLSAKVAVLLISVDFLTSDFVVEKEVPKLLDAHENDGMAIVPVLVWPFPWKRVEWLAKLQLRPRDARRTGKPLRAFPAAQPRRYT
jgi:hypothetical protein